MFLNLCKVLEEWPCNAFLKYAKSRVALARLHVETGVASSLRCFHCTAGLSEAVCSPVPPLCLSGSAEATLLLLVLSAFRLKGES